MLLTGRKNAVVSEVSVWFSVSGVCLISGRMHPVKPFPSLFGQKYENSDFFIYPIDSMYLEATQNGTLYL